MKKIISLVLVVVMMVMALTSCNLVDKLLGKESAETRYTITADEWEAAMGMKNYTMEGTTTQSATMGDEKQENVSTSISKYSENAEYYKSVDNGNSNEYYNIIKDGKSYRVNVLEDGSTSAYEYEWETSAFGEGLDVAFEDLTYDEEKKAYIFNINDFVEGTYEMYFENGKVVKIVMSGSYEMEYSGMKMSVTLSAEMIVSNIGTTVVNVPEFTVE